MRMADIFEDAKDLLSHEEFLEKVSDKIRKFGGLLTEEAAALLVLEELGRFKVDYDRISGIQKNRAVSIRAKVAGIGEIKEFRRKDESPGRVLNLSISDGSGECRLVLWDDDTLLVINGVIKKDGFLRVINGYAKKTDFGLEITKGRYGAIIVE
jgi:ssDNA-binding replication factor A large subunit